MRGSKIYSKYISTTPIRDLQRHASANRAGLPLGWGEGLPPGYSKVFSKVVGCGVCGFCCVFLWVVGLWCCGVCVCLGVLVWWVGGLVGVVAGWGGGLLLSCFVFGCGVVVPLCCLLCCVGGVLGSPCVGLLFGVG